jgi:hypothetical protein
VANDPPRGWDVPDTAEARLSGVEERGYLSVGDRFRLGGTCVLAEKRTPTVRRSGRAPVEVLLTAGAREDILHRAMWQTGADGCETGGGLFGVNAGERVLVTHANGPGELAERTPTSVTFDMSALEHWATINTEIARVGCWHSHPRTSDGCPSGSRSSSRGDLASWRAGLERINREKWAPHYLGLILTGERNWGRPTIHAWILDYAGELERATVTELGRAFAGQATSCAASGRRVP